MQTPYATVLIPAYNEETVIHRSLTPLASLAAIGRIEVIVVANGCHDETVRKARMLCPQARIVNLAEPSKTRAMNMGASMARGRALVCLDADLSLSKRALRALVDPLLCGEADMSFGRMRPVLSRSSWLVRAFYRGWALSPYFDQGKAGGVIAMSQACVKALFPIRPFTSDDEFLSRFGGKRRQLYVKDAVFEVHAPRRLSDLLAIRRRSRRGTAAIERAGFIAKRPTNLSAFALVLKRALAQPARWVDVAVYAGVILTARVQLAFASSGKPGWERDSSSREAGANAGARS